MPICSLMRRARYACRLLCPILVAALPAGGCTPPNTGSGPPESNAIPPETLRVAYQSRCAQNVIECTGSWPTAVVRVEAIDGGTVTPTQAGFLVETSNEADTATVQLIGSDSSPGDGASITSFSWSYGATDSDACSVDPGTEFSTQTDPEAELAVGLHYIRLSVQNDIIRERVESDACGLIGEDIASFDFIEIEVEIR